MTPGIIISMLIDIDFARFFYYNRSMRLLKSNKWIAIVLCAVLSAVLLGILSFRHTLNAPERAVRDSLSQIEALDSSAAADLFRPSRLGAQGASSDDLSRDEQDALCLFFKDFSFRILESHIQDKTASVKVEAKGTDAAWLAERIREEQIRQSYVSELLDLSESSGSEGSNSERDIYSIMKNILSSEKPSSGRTEETLTVSYGKNGWAVVSDSALKHLLTGGLLEYLDDPYLLAPEDILSVCLSCYRDLTPDEWAKALKSGNLFQISSSSYEDLDKTCFQKISEVYAYQIEDVRTEGDLSDITVSITSIDMMKILTSYRDKLVAYAKTADSAADDSAALSDRSASLLKEALEQNSSPKTTSVTIRLEHDETTWQISDKDGLVNALLGDIRSAVSIFHGETEQAVK